MTVMYRIASSSIDYVRLLLCHGPYFAGQRVACMPPLSMFPNDILLERSLCHALKFKLMAAIVDEDQDETGPLSQDRMAHHAVTEK